MRYPRPPADDRFGGARVFPELAGKRLGDVIAGGMGVRLYCCACGRDVVMTPLGLSNLDPRTRRWSVDRLVQATSCATCGAKEARASGWPLENAVTATVIVRQEHYRGPRLDR